MARHQSHAWDESLEASTVSGSRATHARPRQRLPALTILAHPDVGRVGARMILPALVSGREVELSRLTPTFSSPGTEELSRPLADPRVSRKPLRLLPGPAGGVRMVRTDPRISGRVDGAPLGDEHSIDAEALERGTVLELADRVALLLHKVLAAPPRRVPDLGLVGASDGAVELRSEIERVGPLDLPVLLRGESGTGKELVSRALHAVSARRDGPFVAINMAAVPPGLAAAELFGAERGAFTGADRRREGSFRRADGGTLFLDEVGATPVEVQNLLLRALESREVQSVGAALPQRVDVRLIAATDADLEADVGSGEFRVPLLHRLAGWVIQVPPLRRRRDDVARLLVHFLRQELSALGAAERLRDPGPRGAPWLPAPLVARLVGYSWPGNVRELRNAARQIAVGGHDQPRAALPPHLESGLSQPAVSQPAETQPGAREIPVAKPRPRRTYRQPGDVTDDELLAALRAQRWRLQPTAVALGVSRTSLYALIERCPRIRKAADLERGEIAACLEEAGGDVDAAAQRLEVSVHGLLLRVRELGLEAAGHG